MQKIYDILDICLPRHAVVALRTIRSFMVIGDVTTYGVIPRVRFFLLMDMDTESPVEEELCAESINILLFYGLVEYDRKCDMRSAIRQLSITTAGNVYLQNIDNEDSTRA